MTPWTVRWSADSPWPLRTEPVPLAELIPAVPITVKENA